MLSNFIKLFYAACDTLYDILFVTYTLDVLNIFFNCLKQREYASSSEWPWAWRTSTSVSMPDTVCVPAIKRYQLLREIHLEGPVYTQPVFFLPKHELVHPENPLFPLSKKNFSGSKYPKKS